MINFASLFNQFRMSGSSIGDLIDSPGVTLDRLLDQDSFSNEFKSGNSKVMQFMKYDKYEVLVKYITEVGPADDRKRSYKYPLSACQLLSSDSNQTLDFFFGQKPIIIEEQVVEEPETKKPVSDAEASSKEDQAKANDKVVINDKLDGQGETQQTASTSQKPQTPDQPTPTEQPSKTQPTDQDKPQQKTTQEQATPKTKTIEKEVEPLRHALFNYFKGQVNYTLAGYVCKVFNAFFGKKPVPVMKFLLDAQRFKFLVNHIESRSVGELVVKILTQESNQLMEQRKAAFQHMLEKMGENKEVFIISNLSASVCETIQKVSASVKASNENSVELSQLFFTPAIITQIISNVISDQENVSVYNAPVLQTYLTNVPLVIPEKSQIIEDLKQLLLSFLKKTLEKLKVNRESRPTLGFGRMKIVEIMSFVLKENILSARELAASQPDFFSTLFALCKNYQYNNILHNEIVKIVEIALNEPEGSAFLASLLRDDIFLNFLIGETEEDQKIRAGSGSQRSRKGYIGHLVTICRKVQEYESKNSAVRQLNSRKQFQKVIEQLVNKQIQDYNKTLAGYSMKRGNKHPILFAKQQILQQHIKFLAATPPPVYVLQLQPINIQHPDLQQAQKVQMQVAAKNATATTTTTTTTTTTNEDDKDKYPKEDVVNMVINVMEGEGNWDPRFFGGHLQYNVDDLMSDL